jgi:hypothetical protein
MQRILFMCLLIHQSFQFSEWKSMLITNIRLFVINILFLMMPCISSLNTYMAPVMLTINTIRPVLRPSQR